VDAVSKFGLVGGVGVSTMAEPRVTVGGDPYFTDGLRGVLSSLPWLVAIVVASLRW